MFRAEDKDQSLPRIFEGGDRSMGLVQPAHAQEWVAREVQQASEGDGRGLGRPKETHIIASVCHREILPRKQALARVFPGATHSHVVVKEALSLGGKICEFGRQPKTTG